MTIKELRKQYNITQSKLSEITGIPVRSISNWETVARECAPYIPELVACRLREWDAKNVETKTLEELRAMSENSTDIELLTDIYKELEDRNFIEQANGSLSALANLREPDGTLFDDCFFNCFFNCEEVAKKYDDWDEECESRAFDFTNAELREKLDDEDKQEYIKLLKSLIDEQAYQLEE